MAGTTRLLTWAREEAAHLRKLANRFFTGDPREATVKAMQFFAEHAHGTTFEAVAQAALDRYYKTPLATTWPAVKGVAQQLEEWATYRESRVSTVRPYEVQFRIEAANDIMEQAQLLVQERDVHPAAPIMLAGAALEETLRSWHAEVGSPEVDGKPSISSYAQALRKAGVLKLADVHEVNALGALRNDAAHGRFDGLTSDRAKWMIEGVNGFILRRSQ